MSTTNLNEELLRIQLLNLAYESDTKGFCDLLLKQEKDIPMLALRGCKSNGVRASKDDHRRFCLEVAERIQDKVYPTHGHAWFLVDLSIVDHDVFFLMHALAHTTQPIKDLLVSKIMIDPHTWPPSLAHLMNAWAQHSDDVAYALIELAPTKDWRSCPYIEAIVQRKALKEVVGPKMGVGKKM